MSLLSRIVEVIQAVGTDFKSIVVELAEKVDGSNAGGVTFGTTNVSVDSGLYVPVKNVHVVAPGADSQSINFAAQWQVVFVGAGGIVGGGHIVGSMGWAVQNSAANMAMGIGVEGRFDQQGTGITDRGQGLLGLTTAQHGKVNQGYGVRSELQVNTGAEITDGYGYEAKLTQNAGTMSTYTGYYMPRMSGLLPVPATMRFLDNREPLAPIVSAAPVIDQSYVILGGVGNGFAYPIADYVTRVQLVPAATLATGTVQLPPNPIDGQEVTIATTQQVTALALNGNGRQVFGAITTLLANSSATFCYAAGAYNVWFRKDAVQDVLGQLLTGYSAKTGAVAATDSILVAFGKLQNGLNTTNGLLDAKQFAVAGKGLSTEDYTTAEKTKLAGITAGAQPNVATNLGVSLSATIVTLNSSTGTSVALASASASNAGILTAALYSKLAGLDGNHYRGTFTSLATLTAGVASPVAGDYADVDAGAGSDVLRYIWDVNDSKWVAQGGSTSLTAAQVKTLYESNPDTNALTSTLLTKLNGIATNATAFTAADVRSTPLTGGTFINQLSPVTAADTVLTAMGKFQSQFARLPGLLGAKVDKVAGKALSTNDYTNEDKAAVASIDPVGTVTFAAKSPGSSWFQARGSVKAQVSARALFAALGLLSPAIGLTYSSPTVGSALTPVDIASAPAVSLLSKPRIMQLCAGGVVRFSPDGGANWSTVTSTGQAAPTSLSYDEGNKVWIATGNTSSAANNIVYSADDGATWTPASFTSAAGAAGTGPARCVANLDGTWLATLVASSTTAYRSTNLGATWTAVVTGTAAFQTAISQDNAGVWCIVAGSQIRRSFDDGVNWSLAFSSSQAVGGIANDRQGTWLISGTAAASSTYRSQDNGVTWALLTTSGTGNCTDVAYSRGFFFLAMSATATVRMISSTNGANAFLAPTTASVGVSKITATGGYVAATALAATSTILLSTPSYGYNTTTQFKLPSIPGLDGVSAWIKWSLGLVRSARIMGSLAVPAVNIVRLGSSPTNKLVYADSLGGLATYDRKAQSLTSTTLSAAILDIQNNGNGRWLAAAANLLWGSSDDGLNWTPMTGTGAGPVKSVAVLKSGYMFATSSGANVPPRRSLDGGASWGTLAGMNSSPGVVATDGDQLVQIHTTGIVYSSADGGVTFDSGRSIPGLTSAATSSAFVGADGVCGVLNQLNSGNFALSLDSGKTWTVKTVPAPASSNPQIAYGKGGMMALRYTGLAGLLYSIDYGDTWTASTTQIDGVSFTDTTANAALCSDTSGEIYYSGTYAASGGNALIMATATTDLAT